MTTLEAIKGISSYPIPLRTIQEVAERRGVSLDAEANVEVLMSEEYKLVNADLLTWLSYAPQISQGGQSFSFTDEQRLQFRNRANELYSSMDATDAPKVRYGYKGSRL